jgi:Mycotoxin biosynthesis protein UstYa
MWYYRAHTYSRVPKNDEKGSLVTVAQAKSSVRNAILIVTCFAAGALGFLVTQEASRLLNASPGLQCKCLSSPIEQSVSQDRELILSTVETIGHTFQYNRSFSYPPSNHTNRAWRNIFPVEGGFFIHPTIAPTRSTFSVFHQLHCLVSQALFAGHCTRADLWQNGLRGGYWANHHAASVGQKLVDDDLPVDIQESHMRHCIDLLRQALMCHADTTLEVVDEKINGVHGFRVEHQCKDWEQLKKWTSEQQARQHVEQIV